jgi:hypothetical protein
MTFNVHFFKKKVSWIIFLNNEIMERQNIRNYKLKIFRHEVLQFIPLNLKARVKNKHTHTHTQTHNHTSIACIAQVFHYMYKQKIL